MKKLVKSLCNKIHEQFGIRFQKCLSHYYETFYFTTMSDRVLQFPEVPNSMSPEIEENRILPFSTWKIPRHRRRVFYVKENLRVKKKIIIINVSFRTTDLPTMSMALSKCTGWTVTRHAESAATSAKREINGSEK